MKKDMKHWLKKQFVAAILMPVLSIGVEVNDAMAVEEKTALSRVENVGQAAQAICQDIDLLLIGDTDHREKSLYEAVADPEFVKGLKVCDITHLFLELSTSLQGLIDDFQMDKISFSQFQESFLELGHNAYDLDKEVWREILKLEVEMLKNVVQAGITIHAADVGTTGDVKIFMGKMLVEGAWEKLKKSLGSEKPEYEVYYDLMVADRMEEIPENEREKLKNRLEILFEELEIQSLIDKGQKILDEGVIERKNDTKVVKYIMENLPQDKKGAVIFGVRHMSDQHDKGMDQLFSDKGLKIKRLDLVASKESMDYTLGQDLPDLVFVTETSSLLPVQGKSGALISRPFIKR